MTTRSTVDRLARSYTATAVIIFNVVLLFVAANLVAAVVLARMAAPADGPATYERAWLIEGYGLDRLAPGYPGMSKPDLEALLTETSNWFHEYEPFTGFRPVPRRDRFTTIDPNGFRPVPGQAPWPPAADTFNLFLFGGSTMMGAGVPDGDTIAAHLQKAMATCDRPVAVYNFGRGFYFSTQERVLFEQLLLAGITPDATFFFDGLNDFYFADGRPRYTPELTDFFARQSETPPPWSARAALASVARAMPAVELASRWGYVDLGDTPFPTASPEPADSASAAARVERVLDRWQINARLIRAAAQAVDRPVRFVWQPVPTYGYDVTRLNVYRPGVDLFGAAHSLSAAGYPIAAARHRDGRLGSDVLWLGEIQRTRAENLYVDAVHYTGAFSREIAGRLFEYGAREKLIPCRA
jgi:hypothetical protein